jgi:hypothetical protein
MNNCRPCAAPHCRCNAAKDSRYCADHAQALDELRALCTSLQQAEAAMDTLQPTPIAPPVMLHEAIMGKIREGAS